MNSEKVYAAAIVGTLVTRLGFESLQAHSVRNMLHHNMFRINQDAARHARRWFQDHAARSVQVMRAIPEGRKTQLSDLHLVAELLLRALTAVAG